MLLKGLQLHFFNPNTNKVDINLVCLFLNIFLVVFSYWAMGFFGAMGFFAVKSVRLLLIFVSLALIIIFPFKGDFKLGRQRQLLWLGFLAILFYSLPFSLNLQRSIERLITIIPFLIYIDLIMRYMFNKYGAREAKFYFLRHIRVSYSFAIITLFLFSGGAVIENLTTGLYGGEAEDGGFKSNTYAWGATLYIVATIELMLHRKIHKKWLLLNKLIILLFVFIIILTGSRSSQLCIAITMALLFINKFISFRAKFFTIVFGVMMSVYVVNLVGYENMLIMMRLSDQAAIYKYKGEDPRIYNLRNGFEAVQKYRPGYYFGIGFDNAKGGISTLGGHIHHSIHNSYADLFFCTGFFSIFYFVVFFVLNSVVKFIYYDMRTCVFLPTMLLVPLFENNFGAGQFFFFPWILAIIYYSYYPRGIRGNLRTSISTLYPYVK